MLTFVYDIVCPYAYMAATQVQALADAHGQTVRWQPVLLGGLYQHHQAPQVPSAGWPAAKAALGVKDILRAADQLGVPLNRPANHPRRTVNAMRLCLAASPDVRPALSLALFSAYWVDGLDVSDPTVLSAIASRFGLDPNAWADPALKPALRTATADAAERGVFGVPTFFLGDQMWWGADRLHFVAEAMSGTRDDPAARVGPPGQTLRFFHDFASPFSYLGATQVERVAARHGATVDWRPFLLGALFREIGTPNVPMVTYSAAKQRAVLADLHRWADRWGQPFGFPTCFPVRTVLPLRVSLQAPAAILPLYRALWADNRNIGDPGVVADVLTEAGLDADALIAGAADPNIKQQLRDNGALAINSGVVGVPGFVLDDGMVIWGQDRLHQLDLALSGWRPRPEAR